MSIQNGNGENDESDGSGIFWPGYVDAVTNLVLNLLFLITILAVAVFMFALELGRSSNKVAVDSAVPVAKVEAKNAADLGKKVVPATLVLPQPKKGLLATEGEVTVRFIDEAVNLTEAEHVQLREALKQIVAGGGALIYIEVPTGFSEAKRMGFYRAMEVRNVLMEMNMPQKRIDVIVREGKSNSNASLVRVIPQ